MKAITIWQPWASLMALKLKKIETRSWYTLYRGPLLIHAAKRALVGEELKRDFPQVYEFLVENNINPWLFPVGAIVGKCELITCHRIRRSEDVPREPEKLLGDHSFGRIQWITKNMQFINQPIPYKGRQGLWDCNIKL